MCTRVFNNQNLSFLSTSRNMDWAHTMPTSLYFFNSGLKKEGLTTAEFTGWYDALKREGEKNLPSYQPVTWESEFASVVAMVGSDEDGWACSDGINSAGLVANVLYDTGFSAGYNANLEQLSVLRWAQYVLDNYDRASEVKKYFEETPPQLVAAEVPGSPGKSATLHLSVSDVHGDSLIVEVENGKYSFFYNPEYTIMTNEPNYEEQLVLLQNIVDEAGKNPEKLAETIPGGPYSPNRFERAAYYYHFLKEPKSSNESLAQSKGVTASASVPVGFDLQGTSPNNASTLWTAISDQTRGQFRYYFNNAQVVNIVWFDLQDLSDHIVASLEMVTVHPKTKIVTNFNYDGCINTAMKPASDPFAQS